MQVDEMSWHGPGGQGGEGRFKEGSLEVQSILGREREDCKVP